MCENTFSLGDLILPMEKIILQKKTIKEWSVDERPREKFAALGAQSLSNAELIAILLQHGTRERTALELARDVMQLAGDNVDELGKLKLSDLRKIKGIGSTKAISVLSALELGRRRLSAHRMERITVKSSNEIALYLKTTLRDYAHEVFAVVFLNRANKIKHFEIVSNGGITGTVADPRIILRKALEHEATSLVLTHNHPSGNLQPSKADREITEKLRCAASYFDIQVLDHIIVSDDGYFSFADEGLI